MPGMHGSSSLVTGTGGGVVVVVVGTGSMEKCVISNDDIALIMFITTWDHGRTNFICGRV